MGGEEGGATECTCQGMGLRTGRQAGRQGVLCGCDVGVMGVCLRGTGSIHPLGERYEDASCLVIPHISLMMG